jgi:hypothetical protein
MSNENEEGIGKGNVAKWVIWRVVLRDPRGFCFEDRQACKR